MQKGKQMQALHMLLLGPVPLADKPHGAGTLPLPAPALCAPSPAPSQLQRAGLMGPQSCQSPFLGARYIPVLHWDNRPAPCHQH